MINLFQFHVANLLIITLLFSEYSGGYRFNIRNENIKLAINTNRTIKSVQTNMKNTFDGQHCRGCTDPDSGRCNKKHLFRVVNYRKELKCQPEPQLVKLKLPGPDYTVEPSVAKVKQCNGYCRPSFESCIPLETTFVTIPVMLTHHSSGTTKCVEYEVEQHISCACGCKILKEDCSERHIHERCSCKCKNQNEMYKCLNDELLPKTIWDEHNCECICEPEICPVGLAWNAKDCRCDLISRNDIQNLLY